MTTFIVIAVIVLVVLAVAAYVIRQRNREANITRADQLRSQSAARAQSTLPPAQDRAAETEAKAAEARAVADQAEAEALDAQIAASQAEASHEAQVRAADRLDPRVDHKADDYEPQVGGTVDQQPTAPADVNTEDPTPSEPTPSQPAENAPLLPRRNPGTNEMPGKPMETDGTSGGWFTRKDSDDA